MSDTDNQGPTLDEPWKWDECDSREAIHQVNEYSTSRVYVRRGSLYIGTDLSRDGGEEPEPCEYSEDAPVRVVLAVLQKAGALAELMDEVCAWLEDQPLRRGTRMEFAHVIRCKFLGHGGRTAETGGDQAAPPETHGVATSNSLTADQVTALGPGALAADDPGSGVLAVPAVAPERPNIYEIRQRFAENEYWEEQVRALCDHAEHLETRAGLPTSPDPGGAS